MFGDTINAVALAAPFAMASSMTTIAACYDMSRAGAEVFAQLGFGAQVLPCSALASGPAGRYVALGFTEEDCRNAGNPLPPRFQMSDVSVRAHAIEPAPDGGHHVVIEVSHRNARAVVDLTLGQLRLFGVPAPLVGWSWCPWGQWPHAEFDDWHVQYGPSPRPETAVARANMHLHKLSHLVTELQEMALLARRSSDPDDFHARLQQMMGVKNWNRAVAVIGSWTRLESPK